jgi:hypothetical protein
MDLFDYAANDICNRWQYSKISESHKQIILDQRNSHKKIIEEIVVPTFWGAWKTLAWKVAPFFSSANYTVNFISGELESVS